MLALGVPLLVRSVTKQIIVRLTVKVKRKILVRTNALGFDVK